MKKTARILFFGVFAALATVASAGDITGKIILNGAPPKESLLPLDPLCKQLHGSKSATTRYFVVGKGGALADVFIHLKEGVKNPPPPSKKPVVIDQKKCEYLPYVVGVQTGQVIHVLNSDPVLHNVHPTPRVKGNPEKNFAQLPKGPPLKFKYDNPEIFIRFKCDIHPWMYAYVAVVPHPYFAVSGVDGSYTIKNVPAGKYTLEIYHRRAGKMEKEIEVGASGKLTVNFTLNAPK